MPLLILLSIVLFLHFQMNHLRSTDKSDVFSFKFLLNFVIINHLKLKSVSYNNPIILASRLSVAIGADAKLILFPSSPTQSIGLLSYTFLRSTGMEDIVVPMVMLSSYSLILLLESSIYHKLLF